MSEKGQPIVVVKDLYKSFRLPHERSGGIKQVIIGFFSRKHGYETQRVLKDISFEVKKGEFVGIVGRNGSGKSTLLKLLAGIYTPDKGLVQVRGSLTPFIELGVGFNFELTGRENVFLNCALLGLGKREVEDIYDSIVEFAELEKFMDQKLKNYSSGMQVRLAFAIAVKSTSDVLIFDEVLAVGDTNFQKKCFEYFRAIKNDPTRTIILVTHDMSAVEKFCDRAIVLQDGKVLYEGNPNEAAAVYQEINFSEQTSADEDESKILVNFGLSQRFSAGDMMNMHIAWDKELKGVKNVGVALFSLDGAYVYGTNTVNDNYKINENQHFVTYNVNLNLGKGVYSIKVGLFGETDDETVYFSDKAGVFQVVSEEESQGIARLEHSWDSSTR